MSKMSQLNAELTEQASELGFESIEQAEANGYIVKIDMNGNGWLEPDVDKAMEEVHEAWLKEREEVLEELKNLHEYFVEEDDLHYSIVVAKAIKLLEKGEA